MKTLFKILGLGWMAAGVAIALNPSIMIQLMLALLPTSFLGSPPMIGYISILLIYFIFPGLILVGIGSMIKKDMSEADQAEKEEKSQNFKKWFYGA